MSREGFGSKIGIIAAAAGSAVGLGNIYRFPCVLGNNGGGAFLLIYLLIVLCLGIPVMLSEFVIGRNTQRNPIGAFRMLKPKSGWPFIGYMGVFCAFVIMAFYSTVAGWTLEYIVKAVGNQFHGKDLATIDAEFEGFQQIGWKNVLWQGVFIFLTGFVVYKGVSNGIEKYVKILMPLLVVILIVLGVYSLTLPGAGKGLSFLFKPDFSKVDGPMIMSALGQAFFSLSMGMGVLITYGSYIKKDDNMVSTSCSVVLADTLVAVLAGLVIFPAAASFSSVGLDELKPGPGLVFSTLPELFNHMPGGYFFCIIFFVLLAVAALTSTISLLEVVVAYFVEELHLSRRLSTVLASVGCMGLGVFASLSLKTGSPFAIAGLSFFECLDLFSDHVLLPVGAFFIVVFVGWIMGKNWFNAELTNDGKLKLSLHNVIFFIVKYIAPLAIVIIFAKGIYDFIAPLVTP